MVDITKLTSSKIFKRSAVRKIADRIWSQQVGSKQKWKFMCDEKIDLISSNALYWNEVSNKLKGLCIPFGYVCFSWVEKRKKITGRQDCSDACTKNI